MLSHITIGTNDLARAMTFYDAVLGELGIRRHYTFEGLAGYGPADGAGRCLLWLARPYDGKPAAPGNGWHAALLAEARDHVDRFHATAMAEGGTDEGAPGLRPHYHEHYYAAYVRDLDGNKIQAVCHTPPA